MINQLKIKKYQSHKRSIIDFNKGINVIVGATDSGKSAILRALNLVINNRPTGNDFITHGEEKCQVTLKIDNNEIERYKSLKGDNEYSIYENDSVKTFKAIGQEVPEEVSKRINFDEINLQKQFDSHFLLSESSGEVARILNKIVNLDIIDRSLANVESKKRSCKREIETLENETKEIEEDLVNYQWIEKAEKLIIKTKEMVNKIKEIENKELSINNILEKYNDIDNGLKKINSILDKVDYDKLEKDVKRYEKISKKYDNLNNLVNNYNEIIENLKKYDDLNDKIHDLNNLMILSNEYEEINNKISLVKKLLGIEDSVFIIDNLIDKTNKELKKITKDGIICPIFECFCKKGKRK